jgi:hypothetical protein
VHSGYVGANDGDAEPAWVTGLRNDIKRGSAKSFNSSAHSGPHILEPLQAPAPPFDLPPWFPTDVNAFYGMTNAHADDLVGFYGLVLGAPAGGAAAATEAVLASKRSAIAAHIGFRGV